MSDIEKELQLQIDDVINNVKEGKMTSDEGKYVLSEIQKAYSAMDTAKKEIIARRVLNGVSILSKLL